MLPDAAFPALLAPEFPKLKAITVAKYPDEGRASPFAFGEILGDIVLARCCVVPGSGVGTARVALVRLTTLASKLRQAGSGLGLSSRGGADGVLCADHRSELGFQI
jgi:hypothetical protein